MSLGAKAHTFVPQSTFFGISLFSLIYLYQGTGIGLEAVVIATSGYDNDMHGGARRMPIHALKKATSCHHGMSIS